jgi:hypothetical protein
MSGLRDSESNDTVSLSVAATSAKKNVFVNAKRKHSRSVCVERLRIHIQECLRLAFTNTFKL